MIFRNLYKVNYRYIRWVLLTLLIQLLLSQNILALDGNYPIINFTPDEYKSGIQNISFAQNRNMKMFVANNLGILEYEGNEWTVHNLDTGKKFRSLAFDKEADRLYVGSQGTFGYFEGDWSYFPLETLIQEKTMSFDDVWDVYIQDSIVYFCTFSAIYVYDQKKVSALTLEGGLDHTFLVGNTIYTQNSRGNLFEVNKDQMIPLNFNLEAQGVVGGIVSNNLDLTIIYTSGEIVHTVANPSYSYQSLQNALKGKYINNVTELSDSRIAISTQTDGIYLYNPIDDQLEHITSSNGLLSNTCLTSYQDYAGNLWVGMQNGIAIIDINSDIRSINEEINLRGSGYDCFEDQTGTYFTTSNGIYFKSKNEEYAMLIEGTEGPAYSIKKIGNFLYACHHNGLFQLDKTSARLIAKSDGLWNIKKMVSHPGYIIGGTYSGLFLFKLDEQGKISPIRKIEGFDESSRFFEEDPNGKIWVGQFYKGLFLLKLSENLLSVEVDFFETDITGSKLEQVILSRIDNKLYVASKNGLFKIDYDQLKISTPEEYFENIMDQQIHLFKEDKFNNIHVIAEQSIGYYQRISGSNYSFIPSPIYEQKYFLNNDLLNISSNLENGVLFNANEGFLMYIMEGEYKAFQESPPIVSKVISPTENKYLYLLSSFEEIPDLPVKIVAKAKSKLIQFDIDYFSFTGNRNREYRYFLEGFEDDYGAWSNTSLKEYTNLKPGTYTFYVQTRNQFGQTISGAPLEIEVQPPFYYSTTMKIVYFLLGAFVLILLFRWQHKHLQKKSKTIEINSKIALAQKEKEIQEKEDQKEQALQKLKEEKLEDELHLLQNQLATSTMNLVAKNEFIYSIKEKLQELNKKEKDNEAKRTLLGIVKEIDITLKLQEDWEKFEHHFDQVHGDFLSRLQKAYPNLSPNEMKLCSFLRLNLNTKDIANLMNISTRGVEVARYRLRKKLNLDTGENLSKFILEY